MAAAAMTARLNNSFAAPRSPDREQTRVLLVYRHMNHTLILRVFAGTLAAMALSSCTTSPRADGLTTRDLVCIQASRLRDFAALTNRHIYARESSDKHYLLTMREHCVDLTRALTIATAEDTGRICSRGFDKVYYRSGLSGPMQSCHLELIDAVSSKQHAATIIHVRSLPPDKRELGTWEELPPEEKTE